MSRLRLIAALIVGVGIGAVADREYRVLREPRGPYGRMHHIGVLVPNLDQAVAQWRAMGFNSIEVLPPTTTLSQYHGQPIETVMKKAFIDGTQPRIELMQPMGDAPNPWASELHEHGEVLHHIAYIVPDKEPELRKFAQIGMSDIAGSRPTELAGLQTWDYVKAPDSALIVEFLSTTHSR